MLLLGDPHNLLALVDCLGSAVDTLVRIDTSLLKQSDHIFDVRSDDVSIRNVDVSQRVTLDVEDELLIELVRGHP